MFSLDLLRDAIVFGLLVGCFYAAVSVGLSVAFGLLDVPHIAHPAFLVLGSYATYVLNQNGWDPILAGIALMGWTWFHIMTSRTRIDRQGLHQRWIWDKHMALDDLAFGKLIRVRGLDWLIAPRLYVRTLVGKFAVFYAATPEFIAEFERLVAELKQARRL